MWWYGKKLSVDLQSRRILIRSLPYWHPDIRLSASRTVKNKFLLFLSHPVCSVSLWQPELISSKQTNADCYEYTKVISNVRVKVSLHAVHSFLQYLLRYYQVMFYTRCCWCPLQTSFTRWVHPSHGSCGCWLLKIYTYSLFPAVVYADGRWLAQRCLGSLLLNVPDGQWLSNTLYSSVAFSHGGDGGTLSGATYALELPWD